MNKTLKLILKAVLSILKLTRATNRMVADLHYKIAPELDNVCDHKYHDLQTDCFDMGFEIEEYLKGEYNNDY